MAGNTRLSLWQVSNHYTITGMSVRVFLVRRGLCFVIWGLMTSTAKAPSIHKSPSSFPHLNKKKKGKCSEQQFNLNLTATALL